MTLRLILMRHAKSSWGSPTLPDHDRPLNRRGRDSATALGGWLRERGYLPEQVLSSDSARTRETWALLAEAMGDAPDDVRWFEQMYHASAPTLMAVLNQNATARCVLMLAHNPGIAEFAGMLLTIPPAHPRFRDYPTAATTVIDFDTDRWADIGWGDGKAIDFVIPRELGID